MAMLDNASVQFRTNDDDKDHDTNITIEVRDRVGHLAARMSDTLGPFHDQTSSGPYQLEILNRVDGAALEDAGNYITKLPKAEHTTEAGEGTSAIRN